MFGPMMTSSQKSKFKANFWNFTGYFTKIFPKIFIFRKENSQVNFKLNQIVSDLLQDILILLIDKPQTLSCTVDSSVKLSTFHVRTAHTIHGRHVKPNNR